MEKLFAVIFALVILLILIVICGGKELPKPTLITKKLITSGKMVELWEYNQPIATNLTTKGKKQNQGKTEKQPQTKEELEKKRLRNNLNSYHKFLRLASANFTTGSKFLTLTFDNKKTKIDVKSVEECNKAFSLFIKRLRYKYGKEIKYLATIEFQDKNNRGAVHYHLIIEMPYVKQTEIMEIWKHGGVYIERIKEIENNRHVSAYVAKYMKKCILDERLFQKRKYFPSKNLVKPKEYINEECEEKMTELKKLEKFTETKYYSEYHQDYINYTKYYSE